MSKYFINKNSYKNTREVEEVVRDLFAKYGYEEVADPKEADLAVSIGGDGTFIDTANAVRKFTPIIGINMGTLGYLAEIEPNNAAEALEHYLKHVDGEFKTETRMRVMANWLDSENKSCSDLALNDVVISKDKSSIIDVDIIVDGKRLTGYCADGIIISTPTGSTGYSFSCGGPVVDPISEMIVITPIAPHTIMSRSITISAASTVEIVLKAARGCNTIKVSCDGREHKALVGSSVIVKRTFDDGVSVVKFSKDSFCERLVKKMLSIGEGE